MRKATEEPGTFSVNGIAVPLPVKEPLEYGTPYYVPTPDWVTWTYQEVWKNRSVDEVCLERGLIHLSRRAAIIHAKAMIGESGK